MSALGQKQTYAVQNGMSVLPPIATSIAFFGMSALGQKRTSWRIEGSSRIQPCVFDTKLGSTGDQSLGAKVEGDFDQQIAMLCTILTRRARGFESLNDGMCFSHFIGGRCH